MTSASPSPISDKSIIRCPRLLVCSVEKQLRPTLCFLRELGFVGDNAITCQNTLLLVPSVEWTLLPKLEYLRNLWFGYGDVENMVLRSPSLLTYSVENNLKPKVQYFLDVMNGDLAELRTFRQFFSFSLEGRIRRRHQILLKHGFSMGLAEMLKVRDREFNGRMIEMIMRGVVAKA